MDIRSAEKHNTIAPSSVTLKTAVEAAIEAFAQSGKMLDAALAYAAHGFPIFPLDEVSKAPVPKRDPDPTGGFPKGIPGTGGLYKATCDEATIQRWWRNREYLIGLPMGPRSGVWALDVDTDAEHADDGIAAWRVLTAEHGEITTREHRTASEGLHLLFNYDDAYPIGCSAGSLPKGIEVKGKGGYIVVPPSRRKGRGYYVGVDIDPIDAPKWLTGIIGTPKYLVRGEPRPDKRTPAQRKHDEELLVSAMPFVPNHDLKWLEWTKIGLALYAATNGSRLGSQLFHEFSTRSTKYDPWLTEDRWNEICGSPPDSTGIHKILKIAALNGWYITPTLPAGGFNKIDAARRKIGEEIDSFLGYLDPERWSRYVEFHGETYGWGEPVMPPVKAIKVDTGVGKTKISIAKIAALDKKFLFVVPTHELAEKIEQQFIDHGVNVAVFRGRDRDDPDNPGFKMCLMPGLVEQAVKARTDVTKTCCKFKQFKCPMLEQCGYWKQKAKKPRVWIAASNILFHKQEMLGRFDAVIADENFWKNALVGIDNDEIVMPLAVLASSGSVAEWIIAKQLEKQTDDGGLQKSIFDRSGIDDEMLFRLNGALWSEVERLQNSFRPGMSVGDIKRHRKDIEKLRLTQEKIEIVRELRSFIHRRRVKVSGRLLLDDHKGQRVLKLRGVRAINQQFDVPTLIIDATLPDRKILKVLHPEVEVVTDGISVEMPASVSIRQLRGAPTSKSKIGASGGDKNRLAIRRYILQRWIETGRQKSLVICQLEYQDWLKKSLPKAITVAHYNAIAGLDIFRDVRLLMLAGRTQPGPEAVETIAGALSGAMPESATYHNGNFIWFTPTWRGICLKDGSGVPVLGDQHPDSLCEMIRAQICEAELIQAIGRGRGVNRDDQSPLDIDLLFNTVLSITVDEVIDWEAPSLFWETVIDGVVLTSPVDLMKVWPDIWTSLRNAERTIADGIPVLPGFVRVTYQPIGRNLKPRTAWFDLSLIPDPRAWLEKKIGPLNLYGI